MTKKKTKPTDIKNKSTTEKETYWLKMIDEQEKSGLPINQFTKKKGIPNTTFHEWRKRLKNEGKWLESLNDLRGSLSMKKELPIEAPPVMPIIDKSTLKGVASVLKKVSDELPFRPISEIAHRIPSSRIPNSMELKHRSGFTLVLHDEMDQEFLKKILKMLAEITE